MVKEGSETVPQSSDDGNSESFANLAQIIQLPPAGKVSRFEKGLFRHGTFKFNFDAFLKIRGEQDKRHIEQECYFDYSPREFRELIDNMRTQVQRYVTWSSFFSGKVPAHWGDYPIKDKMMFWDLMDAEEKHVQLSPILIYAAILHPDIADGVKCGKCQHLDVNQLAFLIARRTEFATGVDEAIQAQIKMGMTQEQVKDATKQAVELVKMFKEKSGKLPQGT